jgi:hypothetical protein
MSEQFGVGAGAMKQNSFFLVVDLVDQEPVIFDVALQETRVLFVQFMLRLSMY